MSAKNSDHSQLMGEPFDPADIDITNKLLTIDLLVTRLSQSPQEIEMDTSTYFQRNRKLWDNIKQSLLIESILIQFPLPAFYFDASDNKRWLVVDGLQRLTALDNFIVKKSLKLTGLEFLHQLNGKTYDGLGRDLQRFISETQIVAFTINSGTPADVKFNIFKRINTGGLVLNTQEIRHALNQGIGAEVLQDLASSSAFKLAVGNISKERMQDREFVNRFLAFYLLPRNSIDTDIDNAMDRVLKYLPTLSNEELKRLKHSFEQAMELSAKLFGRYAFRRKSYNSNRINPLNRALFDVVSVVFAGLTPNQSVLLIQRKGIFLQLYEKLINTKQFIDSIATFTGEQRRIKFRYDSFSEIVFSSLGIKNDQSALY